MARAVRLHKNDNVAVIIDPAVSAGQAVEVMSGGKTEVTLKLKGNDEPVDHGNKIATCRVGPGEALVKFGQIIGYAAADIEAGDWVHTHNVRFKFAALDYAISCHIPPAPPRIERTFRGIRRPDGRAATRNYIAIICTVNCATGAAKHAVERIRQSGILSEYPNVDGIFALAHDWGCGGDYQHEDHQHLGRMLGGFAKHPNVGAALIVGLGCETHQPSFLVRDQGLVKLSRTADDERLPEYLIIQELGGVEATVRRIGEEVRRILPVVNDVERVEIPAAELILGLNCGGSDGNSGITANPALGVCSDLLVACGGTAVLAETPEICGAEHLLTRRARSPEIAEKLLQQIRWWEDYTGKFGLTVNTNPSFGNKKGGLTTIAEKSLGAVAKGGSTALEAVYDFAQPVTGKGLVYMDTPGLDDVSVTGIVAGGCHVVVFTTGRGNCNGSVPAPMIKVATNTPMYERLTPDMDLNAGVVLDSGGRVSVEDVGQQIFEEMLLVASGKKTKSEAQGLGPEHIAPWRVGPTL